METAQVPVELLLWMLAILPIVTLFALLVPLRRRALELGSMAMFTAAPLVVIPLYWRFCRRAEQR